MPTEAPEGYTHIEDATARWGHHRTWWYDRVKEGDIPGFKFPGQRGTFLRDSDVETYLNTPQPKAGGAS